MLDVASGVCPASPALGRLALIATRLAARPTWRPALNPPLRSEPSRTERGEPFAQCCSLVKDVEHAPQYLSMHIELLEPAEIQTRRPLARFRHSLPIAHGGNEG